MSPSLTAITPADIAIFRCLRSASGYRSVYQFSQDRDGRPTYHAKVRHLTKIVVIPNSTAKSPQESAWAVVAWYQAMFGTNWRQVARGRQAARWVDWRISRIERLRGWIITVWVRGLAEVVPHIGADGKASRSRPMLFAEQARAERYVLEELPKRYGEMRRHPKPAVASINAPTPPVRNRYTLVVAPSRDGDIAPRVLKPPTKGKYVMKVKAERAKAPKGDDLFRQVKERISTLEVALREGREQVAKLEQEAAQWRELMGPMILEVKKLPSGNRLPEGFMVESDIHIGSPSIPRQLFTNPKTNGHAKLNGKPGRKPQKAAEGPIRFKADSHAGKAAKLLQEKPGLTLNEMVGILTSQGWGATLANKKTSLNSVMWGKPAVFVKDAEGRFTLAGGVEIVTEEAEAFLKASPNESGLNPLQSGVARGRAVPRA